MQNQIPLSASVDPRSLVEESAECCGGSGMGAVDFAQLEGRIHPAFVRTRAVDPEANPTGLSTSHKRAILCVPTHCTVTPVAGVGHKGS